MMMDIYFLDILRKEVRAMSEKEKRRLTQMTSRGG